MTFVSHCIEIDDDGLAPVIPIRTMTVTRRAKRTSKPARTTRRTPPARESSPTRGRVDVVAILASAQPVNALVAQIAAMPAKWTLAEGQALLGCATLLLSRLFVTSRGRRDALAVVDAVLERWSVMPRRGPHRDEFLRNAVAAVGGNKSRVARLAAMVPASSVNAQLLFNLACAHSVAKDHASMLDTLNRALAAGIAPGQVRGDDDLGRYASDPDVIALFEANRPPVIPPDVGPHVVPVAKAVSKLIALVQKNAGALRLGSRARLERVLAIEARIGVSFPNDYRALLTLHDGLAVADLEFVDTTDWLENTRLALRARAFIDNSARFGAHGMDSCLPIAHLGEPDHWLLFDMRGSLRGGRPGYLLVLTSEHARMRSLIGAIDWKRDQLAKMYADR